MHWSKEGKNMKDAWNLKDQIGEEKAKKLIDMKKQIEEEKEKLKKLELECKRKEEQKREKQKSFAELLAESDLKWEDFK